MCPLPMILPSSGRMTYVNRIPWIEIRRKSCQIVSVMIHNMPIAGASLTDRILGRERCDGSGDPPNRRASARAPICAEA